MVSWPSIQGCHSSKLNVDQLIEQLSPTSLEKLIVRGYYKKLNPSMAGHTLVDPDGDQAGSLRTLQTTHYTRYGGGASQFIFGLDDNNDLCVLLEENSRRKKPHWEPVQGYGNPPKLRPLGDQSTEESLPSSLVDSAFEEQLRGKNLSEALTTAYSKRKGLSTPYSDQVDMEGVAKKEIHEETGLDSRMVKLIPVGGVRSQFFSDWGLVVLVQEYAGDYQGILPDSFHPIDQDEITQIVRAPLKAIIASKNGTHRYKDLEIPGKYLEQLGRAFDAYCDAKIHLQSRAYFATCRSGAKTLHRLGYLQDPISGKGIKEGLRRLKLLSAAVSKFLAPSSR